jgi:predicted MFS family arabinose efflux permease
VSATITAPRTRMPVPEVPVGSALRDPQFLRYLGGQAASGLGDQVWYVAMSWSAVRLGSPGAAAIVLTLASLPRLALLLFGGVIADRFDIRRLMLGTDVLRTLITFTAAAIALAVSGIGLLIVVTLVYGAVDGVFMPAAGAMQPRLLKPQQYTSAAVASSVLARLALALGAPIGGVMVAVGGLPLALAVNGITFAVSVVTLATVRPRPLAAADDDGDGRAVDGAKRGSMYLLDLIFGARFLMRQPVLGPLTAVGLLANLGFVGPMNIGIAELSEHRGWGAGGIGLLLTGFGVGAAASALLLLRWKIRRGAGIWISVLCAVSGAALLAMALAPDLGAAVGATAALGLVSGPMAVSSTVLAQQHSPDELRGRLSSFNLLSTYGTVPVASIGTGLAIAAIGVTATFAVCGAIEAAALLWLLAPGFRAATITS